MMTELIQQLIENLRDELKAYGELLALFEEQQEHVMSRHADRVLDSVTRINAQALALNRARVLRETTQRTLAVTVGQDSDAGIFVLAQFLPEDYRPLLQALVRENNQLLTRVQQRARQNHLLLSRSVELMQRFIQSLMPCQNTTVYAGDGVVHPNCSAHTLYEAVG